MVVPKPLRVAAIIVCGVLLAAPAVVCFRGASPGTLRAMEVLHVLFPITFGVLVQACIAEGRARERAELERRRGG